MDENPTRPLTLAQRRFVEAAERIRTDRPTFDDLAYMARELVQVTLPHRNPGEVPAWSRANGNLTMTIRPGWNTRTGKPIGYPYGRSPRLLLFWLTAEAVAAKSRGDHSGRIELGSSLSDFMLQLGLNPAGRGQRSDAHQLRNQMDRLFNASISFEQAHIEDGRHGDERLNMTVAAHSMLWWSPRDPSQAALWDSYVDLSREFFIAITAHPVPLDMRALKELKQSPLALDIYAWLAHEAYRAHESGRGRFVAWSLLMRQMGDGYARATDFQQSAANVLRKIKVLYPTLKLGDLHGGIRIEPESLPAITPRDLPDGRRRSRPPARIAAAPVAPENHPLVTSDQVAGLCRELQGGPPAIAAAPPERQADSVPLERPAWLLAVGRELERQWPGEAGEALLAECMHSHPTRKARDGLIDAFIAAVRAAASEPPQST